MQLTRLRRAGLVVAALFLGSLAAVSARAENVTIFAAASLKTALDEVNAEWSKESGKTTAVSYAASSALAKQIESGAPADIFISADLAWMDYLQEKSLIRAETRSNLLGNRLVLVGQAGVGRTVEIAPGFDLSGLLAGGKLAMGAVDSVPAGKYGKAALEKLGVWASVEASVAGAENVRAALLLVSRGEAPYGIVYATDASADPGVVIAGTFPEDSHPPIVYPIAVTTESRSPEAAAWLDFVRSDKADEIFRAQGFTVLE